MIRPVRELAAFPRFSVCEQLKAQERSPAMVPVGPNASRRFPPAVRFSALVWELGQSKQPLLSAQRQYLRQVRISGNCVWMWMETNAPTD